MPQRTRVLIVEDDADVRNSTAEYLASHDYEVDVADCGEAMRAALEKAVPQLVLLDLKLPGEDGLSLARSLRERYDVSIIMVTAADGVVDRVVGLELGADDYVAKPFDLRELLARVKSVLRRAQREAPAAGARRAARSGSGPARSTSPRTACSTPRAPRCRSPAWSSTCCACSWSIRTRCSAATSCSA